MVCNGALLPVTHIGNGFFFFPFSCNQLALNNIFIYEKMVKNLIYVRHFSIDNWVSVEFDPFGFNVKDLNTGAFLNDVTALVISILFFWTFPAPPAQSLDDVSSKTWRHRLGHPGVSTFNHLLSRKLVPCTSTMLPFCHSCQLGKLCCLPFSLSNSVTTFCLKFCIRMFGPHLFTVCVVINIMSYFWMIFHIFMGLSLAYQILSVHLLSSVCAYVVN